MASGSSPSCALQLQGFLTWEWKIGVGIGPKRHGQCHGQCHLGREAEETEESQEAGGSPVPFGLLLSSISPAEGMWDQENRVWDVGDR